MEGMDPMDENIRIAAFEAHNTYDFIVGRGEEHYSAAPGDVIGPLIREFYVLKYCKSGRGELMINGHSFPVSAGQCYMICPGDVAIETADAHDPWCCAYLVFIGTRANMHFQKLGITAATPLFPWRENAQFLARVEEIAQDCNIAALPSEARRISYAYLILDELQTCLGQFSGTMSLAEGYVNRALVFIEQNFSQNITVSDIAAHLGLTRGYFSSIFRKQMQITPQEYLISFRIARACELFAYPNATVASVANSLHYEPSVFFRHFRRIVGVSPSEYKRHLQETRRR